MRAPARQGTGTVLSVGEKDKERRGPVRHNCFRGFGFRTVVSAHAQTVREKRGAVRHNCLEGFGFRTVVLAEAQKQAFFLFFDDECEEKRKATSLSLSLELGRQALRQPAAA